MALDRGPPGDEFPQGLTRPIRLGERAHLALCAFAVRRGEDGEPPTDFDVDAADRGAALG